MARADQRGGQHQASRSGSAGGSGRSRGSSARRKRRHAHSQPVGRQRQSGTSGLPTISLPATTPSKHDPEPREDRHVVDRRSAGSATARASTRPARRRTGSSGSAARRGRRPRRRAPARAARDRKGSARTLATTIRWRMPKKDEGRRIEPHTCRAITRSAATRMMARRRKYGPGRKPFRVGEDEVDPDQGQERAGDRSGRKSASRDRRRRRRR